MSFSIQNRQLRDEKFKQELFEEVERIRFYLEEKKAKNLAIQLEKKIQEEKLDLEEEKWYRDLIVKLKFIALPHLVDKEIIKLIEENFVTGLEIPEFDLFHWLKIYLLSFNPWGRDEVKKDLIKALKKNTQKIISPIFSEKLKKNISTVSEIINDYDQVFGQEPADKIKQAEYFAKRFKNLTEEEKQKLKKLFEIYEYLKITSSSIRAFEDEITFLTEDGRFQEIRDGRIIEIKVPKAPLKSTSSPAVISETKPEEKPVEPKSALEEKYLEEEKKES
jgi:hypothetical protein